MSAVDVGIGHDDDFMVAELGEVGFLGILLCADSDAERLKDIDDCFGFIDFMIHRFFYIQNLTAKGKDRLVVGVSALFCRTACGVTLDEEEFALSGIAAFAVGELTGETRSSERRLTLHFLAS